MTLSALQTPSFVIHSSVALLLLVAATFLAVVKPKGQTRRAQRRSQSAT